MVRDDMPGYPPNDIRNGNDESESTAVRADAGHPWRSQFIGARSYVLFCLGGPSPRSHAARSRPSRRPAPLAAS